MKSAEISRKLREEPDFIALKRFEYSLKKLLDRYPEGVPVRLIADALEITEEEVGDIYLDVVKRLQETMKIIR